MNGDNATAVVLIFCLIVLVIGNMHDDDGDDSNDGDNDADI